jgi:hypothetical protein
VPHWVEGDGLSLRIQLNLKRGQEPQSQHSTCDRMGSRVQSSTMAECVQAQVHRLEANCIADQA